MWLKTDRQGDILRRSQKTFPLLRWRTTPPAHLIEKSQLTWIWWWTCFNNLLGLLCKYWFYLFQPLKRCSKIFWCTIFGQEIFELHGKVKEPFWEWEAGNEQLYIYMDHVYCGRFGNVWPTPSWLNSLGLIIKSIPEIGLQTFVFVLLNKSIWHI